MAAPDLAISIINHSHPELLGDCLRSIQQSTREISHRVWVVDNATDGRMVDELRREFPEARWLFNEERRGFSYNHNRVLAAADARHYCVLNDDTVLHDGCLDRLVGFLDARPAVGMVGPRTLNADGTIQDSVFRDKTVGSEWASRARPWGWQRNEEAANAGLRRVKPGVDAAQYVGEPASVDWLLGACLVIRGEALRAVGPLDDELSPIATAEDTDWCMRVRAAEGGRWGVWFVPQAEMTHLGGQSLKEGGSLWSLRENRRCTAALFAKHYGRAAELGLRAAYAALPLRNAAAVATELAWRKVSLKQARWAVQIDAEAMWGLRLS
ncbi:MAG: glycosyltransferase family 2 protein [Planctomycetota bacterium]